MRILQTPARVFATGGVESYVCHLSRELAKSGNEVKIICADTLVEQKVDHRISVDALKSLGKISNTNITPGLPLALMREDFDILHTHLPTPWSADWSAVASKIRKRPLVLTYHNDIMGYGVADYLARTYNKTALNFLLEAADRIIVTRSRYASPFLKRHKEKVSIIPVGIDTSAFKPKRVIPQGDVFFLSVLDEYHRYKGLEHLLRALKMIKDKMNNVKLIVGGGGSMIGYYQRLARSLDVLENVRFEGFIAADQLIDYYNGCKLLVLPSTDPAREGFGIVPLEAMACGKPVVTTDIAGVAEDVAESEAGLVVGKENDSELAESMLCILKDEDLARKMGVSGRRLVEEKYCWRIVAGRIEGVYKELLN